MSRPDRITVSRSKRGTTIKASGAAAKALFEAMTAGLDTTEAARQVAESAELSAWCWRSGLIEIGDRVPTGAIGLVRGPAGQLRKTLELMARHGQGASDGKLLVPGLPEAETEVAASDAVEAFLTWGRKRELVTEEGLTWATSNW